MMNTKVNTDFQIMSNWYVYLTGSVQSQMSAIPLLLILYSFTCKSDCEIFFQISAKSNIGYE